tara:strand:- start:3416 stop:4180 length:765 start_codon:yes stop_codon:yes gene_type:complete
MLSNFKYKNLTDYVIFCFVLNFLVGSDIDKSTLKNKSINFTTIEFEVISKEGSRNHLIWLHGDENTAKLSINNHLQKYGGTAYFIKNESREVDYKDTRIDPNRIFSRLGSFHALKKFKPEWSPGTLKSALDELDSERKNFLKTIFPDSNGVLIAVHNNFRGYSVKSEIENSTKVSLSQKENPRDFILCTDLSDFKKLSVGRYNVVLQNKPPEKDNGSLSWAALKNGVRYVNVETRLGWLSKQKKMLEFVEESLE